MSKLNLSIDGLKAFGASLLASGKKNAPSLMTGGSIVLGWVGVYIFWKQSRKAEQKIAAEEAKLNEEPDPDISVDEPKTLPVQDKFAIYLQYCWMAALLGLGSTALAFGANKLNLSRITEMAILTRFMTDKNDKQKDLIEKLEGEVNDKKVNAIKKDIRDKEFSKEEILEVIKSSPNDGTTLFIDIATKRRFRKTIQEVTDGIAESNEKLKNKRGDAIKRRLGDAFFVSSDLPWGTDEDSMSEIYSSLELDEFLKGIGETDYDWNGPGIGNLLEFRYYGGSNPIKPADILEYEQYEDPSTGIPAVCFIDYTDLLSPCNELLERNM